MGRSGAWTIRILLAVTIVAVVLCNALRPPVPPAQEVAGGLLPLAATLDESLSSSAADLSPDRVHPLVVRLLVLAEALDNLQAASRSAWETYLQGLRRLATPAQDRVTSGGVRSATGIDSLPGGAFLLRIGELDVAAIDELEPDGNVGLALLLADPGSPRAEALLAHVVRLVEIFPDLRPIDAAAGALYRARRGSVTRDSLSPWIGVVTDADESEVDSLAATLTGLALARTPAGLSDGLALLGRYGQVLCAQVGLNDFQGQQHREPAARDYFCDLGVLGDLSWILRSLVRRIAARQRDAFVEESPELAEAAWFYGRAFGPQAIGEYLPPASWEPEAVARNARLAAQPVWAWIAATRRASEGNCTFEELIRDVSQWREHPQVRTLLAYPDSLACVQLMERVRPSSPAPRTRVGGLVHWWYATRREAPPGVAAVLTNRPAVMYGFLGAGLRASHADRDDEALWSHRGSLLGHLLTSDYLGQGTPFQFGLACLQAREAWSIDPRSRQLVSDVFVDPLADSLLTWPLADSASTVTGDATIHQIDILAGIPCASCAWDVLHLARREGESFRGGKAVREGVSAGGAVTSHTFE